MCTGPHKFIPTQTLAICTVCKRKRKLWTWWQHLEWVVLTLSQINHTPQYFVIYFRWKCAQYSRKHGNNIEYKRRQGGRKERRTEREGVDGKEESTINLQFICIQNMTLLQRKGKKKIQYYTVELPLNVSNFKVLPNLTFNFSDTKWIIPM